MDRNTSKRLPSSSGIHVALRKESVDRNIMPDSSAPGAGASLSARRAWIEIFAH